VTANLNQGVLHLTAIMAKSEDAAKQKAIAA
jgi:hypothetical protein